jgi:hypothetical protein
VPPRTIIADGKPTTAPRDTSHVSGWDYLPGNAQVQLYGDFCAQLRTDPTVKVEVVVGCETVGG